MDRYVSYIVRPWLGMHSFDAFSSIVRPMYCPIFSKTIVDLVALPLIKAWLHYP